MDHYDYLRLKDSRATLAEAPTHARLAAHLSIIDAILLAHEQGAPTLADEIHECAAALRGGTEPAEVCERIDGIVHRLRRAAQAGGAEHVDAQPAASDNLPASALARLEIVERIVRSHSAQLNAICEHATTEHDVALAAKMRAARG